jgi:DNA-binding LytR/AlgR family response regulator
MKLQAIAIDDEPLALRVIQEFCKNEATIELNAVFTDYAEMLQFINANMVNLVFMDIQMPVLSGLTLAKRLPADCMVIFTTAHAEFGAASYELNAIDYLLKPFARERFGMALKKAYDFWTFRMEQKSNSKASIYVRSEYEMVNVILSDIHYIEGLADYMRIFLFSGRPIVIRSTMKDLLEKLPSDAFIRIHRSYIIPLQFVTKTSGMKIEVKGKVFPIGRTFSSDIRNYFKN